MNVYYIEGGSFMQITKKNNEGEIKIEHEALEKIVKDVALEIKGIDAFTNSRGQKQSVLNLSTACIDLEECEDGYVLDVYIIVKFGFSIKEIANSLINNIKGSFKDNLDIELKYVNVNVKGIKSKKHLVKRYRTIKG